MYDLKFSQWSWKLLEREDIDSKYWAASTWYYRYALDLYKNYYMYNRDRARDLIIERDEWRTNLKSPLTHMFTNNIYNMYLDSDIRFDVLVRNSEKYETTSIVEEIMAWWEYLMSNNDSIMRDELDSAFFDAMFLWTWTHSPSYILENNKKIKRLDKDGVMQTEVEEKDFPSVRYVSPFSVLDFWDTSLLSRRYTIERKIIPSFKIESYYEPYGVVIKKDEIQKKWIYKDTVDREAVKKNMVFYNHASWNDIMNDDTFSIKNKMLEVFEVHDWYTFDLWINSIYHGNHPSLWPYKEIPYINTTFKKIPWLQYWLGVWFLVKPLQEAFDTILNYRIDNVKLWLNKMFFADNSVNMFGNNERIQIKPWKIIKVGNPDSLKEFKMTDVNASAYNETGALFEVTQWMIWVSSMNLWVQWKVERVSWWPELYKASADAQLNQFLRNVSRSMAKTMKFMMIYTLTYTNTKTLDNVLWPNNSLKNLDIKDLIWDFSFDFNITNEKLDTRAVKRNQLMQLMQTGMQVWPDGKPLFTQEMITWIARNLVKSYDLDVDTSSMEKKMNDMMQNEWAMVDAVAWVMWQWQPIQAWEVGWVASMRDLQQQWVPVPSEMTTNAQWNNQFTS